jgi:hypothetical protein
MQWWKQDEQRRNTSTSSKFNIIGFDSAYSKWKPTRTCPVHHCVLVPKKKENTSSTVGDKWEEGLFCPLCGSCYKESEAGTEEHYTSLHGPHHSKIITSKKQNKKYYDKSGNKINPEDKDTLDLIAQGYNITYYHEQSPGPAKKDSKIKKS